MKASYRWLRELVPGLTASAKEVAERLTGAGLEVEATTHFGAAARQCIVAQVTATRQHPQRSGLRLVTVDRGGATQEVVCGAPNVPEPGGLVVFAPVGAHLPAVNMTIARRAIGGVSSDGMLCSERELGLTDDGAGIIVLDGGAAKPGQPFTEAVPVAEDFVYEIGVTANRGDCLGHVGLARDLSALFDVPWRPPAIEEPTRITRITAESLVAVRTLDPERCPHYGGAVVVDVTMGRSPAWLRYRLASLGVRPISNVVDITNLVMLEYGHPMHAFDLDLLSGHEIVVRRARDGERITTLDGVERVLTTDDLLVCDREGPAALAGVMGGANKEIRAQTRRVLFECAYFDPRGVRRTARRHGLRTESSHRFERGVDPGDVPRVLARAVSLSTRLAGGAATHGEIHAGESTSKRTTVMLRSARLDALLGEPISWPEARAILSRLGCLEVCEQNATASFEIPSHRHDLSREVDLIEEVARVRGIDRVPAVLPAIRPTRDKGPREELTRRVRAAAVGMGLSEAITLGFLSKEALAAVGAPAPAVQLENPLTEQQSVMRTSLVPGLLEVVARARRHGERDARLFTVGAVYLKGESLPEERIVFAAVLAGDRPQYLAKPQPFDVWDAKGLAAGLVARFVRRPADVRACEDAPKLFHPRGAAAVHVNGEQVGNLGSIHPDIADALGTGENTVLVELDVTRLAQMGAEQAKFAPLPRYPASTRDIALVVPEAIPVGEVERAVRDAAGALAEEVRLFDRFTGAAVPADHASIAFHVVYRAPDRTLTDEEVDRQHALVLEEVGRRFGAELRR